MLEQNCDRPDLLGHDVFQVYDDLRDESRKARERVKYLIALGDYSLIEKYKEGKLSVILDLIPWGEIDVIGSAAPIQPRSSGHDFTRLIFHSVVVNPSCLDQWEQESVLIGDVQLMQGPEIIIPSLVRLYLGGNEFKDSGAGDIYFLPLKRSFKFLQSGPNRELGVIVNKSRIDSREDVSPCMVESGFQVVDAVPADERQIVFDNIFGFGRFMLDRFATTCRIFLDAGSITVLQGVESNLKVSEMFLGPFDF